jgi:hypothetical protein
MIARTVLAAVVVMAVLARFHTLNGLAAGTALLVLMAALKLLETYRRRDRLVLMVDCNQGWRLPQDTYPPWTLKDAVEVARALERLGVYWMEEPLHRGDRDDFARIFAEHDSELLE